MKNKFSICLCWVGLLCLPSMALAQNLGAHFELRTDKTEYVLGEPVVVYFALTNLGVDELALPLRLEPEYGMVVFEIAREGAAATTYRGWNRKCLGTDTRASVIGEAVYGVSQLFYDGNDWLFATPGSYRITAKLFGEVCSEELLIQVKASTVQPGAAAQLMQEDEAARYLLYHGGDHLTLGLETLGNIINQPKVEWAYATHINLAMGEAYLDDFANYVARQRRPADPQRALGYLVEARQKPVGLYSVVMAHTLLAAAYDDLGQSALASEARQSLAMIVRDQYSTFQPWVDYLVARCEERHAMNRNQ